jgi:hypothetical protein
MIIKSSSVEFIYKIWVKNEFNPELYFIISKIAKEFGSLLNVEIDIDNQHIYSLRGWFSIEKLKKVLLDNSIDWSSIKQNKVCCNCGDSSAYYSISK